MITNVWIMMMVRMLLHEIIRVTFHQMNVWTTIIRPLFYQIIKSLFHQTNAWMMIIVNQNALPETLSSQDFA